MTLLAQVGGQALMGLVALTTLLLGFVSQGPQESDCGRSGWPDPRPPPRPPGSRLPLKRWSTPPIDT